MFEGLSWKKKAWRAARKRRLFDSFGPNSLGIAVKTKNGDFVVAPDDTCVGGQLMQTGEYNPGELQRLQALVSQNCTLLVVGAHIGAFVVPLARRCESVVAIEANPESFRLLETNLRLNGCANVRALHLAASDESGVIDFVCNRHNSGGSKRMPLIRKKSFFYDTPQIRKVRAEALDDVLEGETFDVILLDIEGSEFFALKGMKRLLETAKFLSVEFRPDHLKDVAGVSLDDFMEQIPLRFSSVELPSLSLQCTRAELPGLLKRMEASGHIEDGILFSLR